MLDLNTQTQMPNFNSIFAGGTDPLTAIENAAPPPLGGGQGFGDGIARTLPPGFFEGNGGGIPGVQPATPPQGGAFGGTGPLGGITNLLMQLVGMLGSLLGMGNFGNSGAGNPGGGTGAENYFSNATGSSTGDPHLAFSGTSSAGTLAGTWNSMSAHSDLLDSDSIPGGFSISTTPTNPNAAGITYNASASITTNGGGTAVTYNSDGTASLTQNGVTSAIPNGQNVTLPGESIVWNANGSLQVSVDDGNGGNIATTLGTNGTGVDVRTSATNVDLGGDLISGATQQPTPPAIPRPPIIGNPRGVVQRY